MPNTLPRDYWASLTLTPTYDRHRQRVRVWQRRKADTGWYPCVNQPAERLARAMRKPQRVPRTTMVLPVTSIIRCSSSCLSTRPTISREHPTMRLTS